MKSTLLGLALACAISAPAFAHNGAGPSDWPPAPLPQANSHPLTRAEVKAELAQAQRDGTLAADSRVDYPVAHTQTDSAKTRADVKSELTQPVPAGVAATYRGN